MAKTLSEVSVSTDTFLTFVQKTNYAINAISTECLTANTDANGALTVGNTRLNGIFSANVIAVITELRGGNVSSAGLLTISSNTNVTGAQVNIASNTVLSGANVYVSGAITTLANNTFKANATYDIWKLTTNSTVHEITSNVRTFIINGNGSISANLTVTNRVTANALVANSFTGNTVATVDLTTNSMVLATSVTNQYVSINAATTATQLVDFFATSYTSGKLLIQTKDMNSASYGATELLLLYTGTDVMMTEYAIMHSNGVLGSFSANANSTHIKLYVTPTVANLTVKVAKTLIS
jgi:hypothetical protein